jgi:hypothetical protein
LKFEKTPGVKASDIKNYQGAFTTFPDLMQFVHA